MNLIPDSWTEADYSEFVELLKSMADEKYKRFHSSLVPSVEKEKLLGIRLPKLRELGKQIAKGNPRSFLEISKSDSYEEKMMRAIVIGSVKTEDFDDFKILTGNFIGEINNWAICDSFCTGLKQIKRYKPQAFQLLGEYIKSGDEWKIRVALVCMLDYYLEDEYIDRILQFCDSIDSTPYYVSMANAWLLATAVVKCREKTLNFLSGKNNLDTATMNRAIQKCIDSRRVDGETKAYLRTLGRK